MVAFQADDESCECLIVSSHHLCGKRLTFVHVACLSTVRHAVIVGEVWDVLGQSVWRIGTHSTCGNTNSAVVPNVRVEIRTV